MPDKVRIDKWLWSVRIYKSRTLASDAVKNHKVKLNGVNTKPSASVQRGDRLQVNKNGFNLEFEVVDLIEKRVGAPLAIQCYIDHTTEAERNKYNDWFVGKSGPERRERGAGRPTKRERREIDEFKGGWFDFDMDEED